jgi:cysteine-rich repeat protein
MRIHILAALALVLPACAGDITSPGGGGDDDTGAVCGNGSLDTGETCDDGNAIAGDGCSATCQTEQVATPRVTLSVDKSTITSDLGVDNTIVVTATSEMGFAGTITLAATAKDSTSAAISDWTMALDQTTLTLAANGTATANLTLSALGDAAMLGGTVTVTATGAPTTATTDIGVTFNGVLDLTIGDNAGTCAYPTVQVWKVKTGRQLAVYNGSTTKKFVIHTGGGITGFPHEGDAGTGPGEAYVKTLTGGTGDQIYCHNDPPGGNVTPANGYLATGTTNGPIIQVVP